MVAARLSSAASLAGRLRESMSIETSSASAGAENPSTTTAARSTARYATNGPAPSMALVKSSAMIPMRSATTGSGAQGLAGGRATAAARRHAVIPALVGWQAKLYSLKKAQGLLSNL